MILWVGGRINMDPKLVPQMIEEIQKRRKQVENEIAGFISVQMDKFQKETNLGIPSIYIDIIDVTKLGDIGRLFVVGHCEIRLEI